MKNIIPFKTDNNNYYLYYLPLKQLHSIHKHVYFIFKLLENDFEISKLNIELLDSKYKVKLSVEEFKRATDKTNFYLNNIFEKDKEVGTFKECTPKDIEYSLSDNPNICLEVTEDCNLDCKYCAYSDYYEGFDERIKQSLSYNDAKSVIDYVYSLCCNKDHISYKRYINIGFYGGEPLLKIDFIKKIVGYVQKIENQQINFTFSITTNGILLNRHIDFLTDKNFDILVSLDGDLKHNSYRVFRNGEHSHNIIINNLDKVLNKFPDFFKNKISFNSVAHNLTNKTEIAEYFDKKFNKTTEFADLAFDNLNEEKANEFYATFVSKNINLKKSEELDSSEIQQNITYFLGKLTNHLTNNYYTLLSGPNNRGRYSGTCIPFSRKVFVTSKGKILPCENVNHNFVFGTVKNGEISIDLEHVAQLYNKQIEETTSNCVGCYQVFDCEKCSFHINNYNPENTKKKCYYTKKRFEKYLIRNISLMENHPKILQKTLTNGILL